jgi:hypothetical protein
MCVCSVCVCVYYVADVGGRIGVDLGFAHEDCYIPNIIASMQIHRSAIYAGMLKHNVHCATHLYMYFHMCSHTYTHTCMYVCAYSIYIGDSQYTRGGCGFTEDNEIRYKEYTRGDWGGSLKIVRDSQYKRGGLGVTEDNEIRYKEYTRGGWGGSLKIVRDSQYTRGGWGGH